MADFVFWLILRTSTVDTISYVEELFLEADRALDEGNLAEGKRLLEDILREEPSFGKAHNHMGWLYKNRFSDFATAERHYKLALKFDPSFPHTYLNYAYLLRDTGRLDELESILNKALVLDSINKSMVYDEYGSLYELRGEYRKAIKFYRKAIALSLNDKNISELKAHVKRCKEKGGVWLYFI